MVGNEQPGCLHAGMDLYKWAMKIGPIAPSPLVLDCFDLALDIRTLDMEASPYDLRGWGYGVVAIETAAGKAEYMERQQAPSAAVRRRAPTPPRRTCARRHQLRPTGLAHAPPERRAPRSAPHLPDGAHSRGDSRLSSAACAPSSTTASPHRRSLPTSLHRRLPTTGSSSTSTPLASAAAIIMPGQGTMRR